MNYNLQMLASNFVNRYVVTIIFLTAILSPNASSGQTVTCVNSYSRYQKRTYTIPQGALNPGPNQHNSLRTDVAGATYDLHKTYYTTELTQFNDAQCASGPCENNIPGLAHRTWPLGSCVAVCNLKNQKCTVAKIMDRGPNTKLGCRTIDANPALKQVLDMRGDNVSATYTLLSIGPNQSKVCSQMSPLGAIQDTSGLRVEDFGSLFKGSGFDTALAGGGSPGPAARSLFGSPQVGNSENSVSKDRGLLSTQGNMPRSMFGNPSSNVTVPNESDSLMMDSATITCEDRHIVWACPDTSVSRPVSKPYDPHFVTKGVPEGEYISSVKHMTLYTIQCLSRGRISSTASCTLHPEDSVVQTDSGKRKSSPILSIEIEPEEVVKGKTVTITWVSLNTKSCTVTGPGMHEDGVEGFKEWHAPTMPGAYVFTLECKNMYGDRVQKNKSVRVR